MAGRGKRPTKAEAAAMALRDALAWPSSPEPERLSDEAIKELLAASGKAQVRLWNFNLGGYVELGSTDGRNHNGSGPMNKDNFNTRGVGGPWYSTREDACLAMRWAMTRQAAKGLLSIDGRIACYLDAPLHPDAPEAAEDPVAPGP
jgi:hypothetical protein